MYEYAEESLGKGRYTDTMVMPGTDDHHEIDVRAVIVDAKSHNSSQYLTANTKCLPPLEAYAEISL